MLIKVLALIGIFEECSYFTSNSETITLFQDQVDLTVLRFTNTLIEVRKNWLCFVYEEELLSEIDIFITMLCSERDF